MCAYKIELGAGGEVRRGVRQVVPAVERPPLSLWVGVVCECAGRAGKRVDGAFWRVFVEALRGVGVEIDEDSNKLGTKSLRL